MAEYGTPHVAKAGVLQQRSHLTAALAKEHEGRVRGYL
jgi:hypothetical protein